MDYIIDNLSTLITSIVLVVVVVLVVVYMIKKRGQGKFICGGNCASCSSGGTCSLEQATMDKGAKENVNKVETDIEETDIEETKE